MSEKKKLGFADTVKAVAEKAARGAGSSARAAARGAQVGLGATVDGAKKAKKFVDAQTRAALDKELAKHRPAIVANVARLRKTHPKSTPAEIIDLLGAHLRRDEGKPQSENIAVAEYADYILTVVEIHGNTFKDADRRQLLIDTALVASSSLAATATKVVVAAISALVVKKFAAVGSAAALMSNVAKVRESQFFAMAVSAVGGVKAAGTKSLAAVVISSTSKVLGPPPVKWPVETAARKPAATKAKAPAREPAAKK